MVMQSSVKVVLVRSLKDLVCTVSENMAEKTLIITHSDL